MANSNKRDRGGFVDISSNSQVKRVYKKRGRAKRVFVVILSVLFLICGSGMIYYYSVLESLNYNYSGDSNGDSKVKTKTENTYDGKSLLGDSEVLNVMLFGQDNTGGDSNGNSDSMIMCSIDNRNKKIKLTTFMRDTKVQIPGYDSGKLTWAYAYGGASLAIQTIESNFGIEIDRYAVVDYDSFEKIVDIMGGVDIELTDDEIGYINWQMYINNQADDRNTITDSAGVVHLNGVEALWYARDRGFYDPINYPGVVYSGDDWDRTQRQRKFLSTVVDNMKSASLTQIVSIVSEVGPLVTTNFKKDEITLLVTNALTYLQYDVEQYCIPPGDNGVLWQYNRDNYLGSYIEIIDMETVRTDLANFVFGTGSEETTASDEQ